MTRTIKTKKAGNWEITGVNFIESDSIVDCIINAVTSFSTPKEIANYIGRNYGQFPRTVLVDSKKIIFEAF